MANTAYAEETVDNAQGAIERAAETWKAGARTMASQSELLSDLPWFNPVDGVQQYFDWVQSIVDMNRDFAIRWAETAGSILGAVRDETQSLTRAGVEQAEKFANEAEEQTERAGEATKETARRTRQAADRNSK